MNSAQRLITLGTFPCGKRKLQTILEERGLWNEKGGGKSKAAKKKPARKKSAWKGRKEEKGEEE